MPTIIIMGIIITITRTTTITTTTALANRVRTAGTITRTAMSR